MNDSTTQPTDIDWDSIPKDEVAERIFEMLEAKPAQMTCEDMDNLESWWRDTMRTRRLALVMLTKSWSEIRKNVEDDRKFAEAVASTFVCVKDLIEGCQGILESLEASQNWMMVALARREDMAELLESAEKECGEAMEAQS